MSLPQNSYASHLLLIVCNVKMVTPEEAKRANTRNCAFLVMASSLWNKFPAEIPSLLLGSKLKQNYIVLASTGVNIDLRCSKVGALF